MPDAVHATEFLVLKDAQIYFRGNARELRATADPYLKGLLTGWIPPLVA